LILKRYFNSFFIASIIYSFLIFTFLYSSQTSYSTPNQTKQSTQNVKFTLVSIPKEVPKPQEKIVKQEIKQQVIPKPKKVVKKDTPKKILAKKPKPKKVVQKIVKKDIPKQKPIKKVVEKIVKKTIQPTSKTATVAVNQIKKNKSIQKTQAIIIDHEKIKRAQNKYYSQIKKTIDKNKFYPKMAIRRGIEGEVKIKFCISANGELLSFEIIEGKRVFKKSIAKAIEDSFPLPPPKNTFSNNLDLALTVQYKLY